MNRTQIVKKSLNFEDPGIVPYSIYLTEEGYGLYGDRLIDDYGNEKIQTDYRQGKLSQKEAASLAIGNFILYAEAPWWDWINLPAEFKKKRTLPRDYLIQSEKEAMKHFLKRWNI